MWRVALGIFSSLFLVNPSRLIYYLPGTRAAANETLFSSGDGEDLNCAQGRSECWCCINRQLFSTCFLYNIKVVSFLFTAFYLSFFFCCSQMGKKWQRVFNKCKRSCHCVFLRVWWSITKPSLACLSRRDSSVSPWLMVPLLPSVFCTHSGFIKSSRLQKRTVSVPLIT